MAIVTDLIPMINASPTPFHATATLVELLSKHGFTLLTEGEPWSLEPGGRYLVVREQASVIAFVLPSQGNGAPPLRLACAHTDSPALKLKPNPLKRKRDHLLFDVEIYGSMIQSSWFDRDLSLAGLVSYLDSNQRLSHGLMDCRRPMARIPNLAIHLNRTVNDGHKINPHDEMSPLFRPASGQESETELAAMFTGFIQEQMIAQGLVTNPCTLLGWDLLFYDTQPLAVVGADGQWLSGGRLDNLASCFLAALALVDHVERFPQGGTVLPMLACFHHEEIGSVSTTGAAGNFLLALLERLLPDTHQRLRAASNSWMLSVDNAHGGHPNYPAQQDENHYPKLNHGLVLKSNANMRYATTALSTGYVKMLCQQTGARMQSFAMRADMPCGSTVGPILSAKLGIKTADIGLPTWAMHSIRETAGVEDLKSLHLLLTGFYAEGH